MGFHFFKDMPTSQKAFNSQRKLKVRTSMIHQAIGFHGHQINNDDIMLVHYASGFVIWLINSDEFCCHRLWRKALICNSSYFINSSKEKDNSLPRKDEKRMLKAFYPLEEGFHSDYKWQTQHPCNNNVPW